MFRQYRVVSCMAGVAHLSILNSNNNNSNTAYRTFFGKFGKISDNTNGNDADSSNNNSSNNNNNNNKSEKNKNEANPFKSSHAEELKLRQMSKIYEMLANQPKEKQLELMKQAMAMQHSLSRIPGLGKLAEKNMPLMEEMLNKVAASAEPSSPSPTPLSPSMETIMTSNTLGQSKTPSTSNSSAKETVKSTINNNNNNNYTTSTTRAVNTTTRGPTLDELKTINLGSEIEALFEELRTIRAKKNEYRQKYQEVQATLTNMENEKQKLISSEVDLRARLRKAEQELINLTNVSMELEELRKEVKTLEQVKRKSEQEIRTLQDQADKDNNNLSSPTYIALQQQLQSKEDALRSLHRKLDRLRLRDPLLQFSLACSDIGRLCNNVTTTSNNISSNSSNSNNSDKLYDWSNTNYYNNSLSSGSYNDSSELYSNDLVHRATIAAENAFNKLRETYEHKQQEAWEESANTNGLAAAAFAATVQRFYVSNIPHTNLDAVLTVHFAYNNNVESIKATFSQFFASLNFTVEVLSDAFATSSSSSSSSLSSVKLLMKTASDASSHLPLPGPFGYALALKEVNTLLTENINSSSNTKSNANLHRECNVNMNMKETLLKSCPWLAELHVLHVVPFVSEELARNRVRSCVQMESARASGPGGQATNVSETQIYAKLSIDGVPLYTSEAQDSRSALNNREAALDKLWNQRRHQFNEQLAKQFKYEECVKQIIQHLNRVGECHVSDEVMQYVTVALENETLQSADVMLIVALHQWCCNANAYAEESHFV